ncbi:MAG TPA: glycolate oxidase subunit GlcF, partial [Burkholderiales bacterium]|nr:glycolate oxidase subunit GlcF [Burkholderiales bacterium]
PALFNPLLKLGQLARPLLPEALRRKVPAAPAPAQPWPQSDHPRKMLVLEGCVQPALSPATNAAAARVLDRIGISLLEVPGAGCCGAVRFHLNYQEAGRDDMRALIDAWWPVACGREAEAIVMTASGCGATVKDYVHLLATDAAYRGKAERISAMTRDLSEVIDPAALPAGRNRGRVAFHSPCTLQHGQQIRGKVEALLSRVGYELTPVRDAHLCCGSAGTYSLLQPAIAGELRARKLAALEEGGPQAIATANIGCLAHLQEPTATPVRHWIELVDAALA